MYKSFYKQCIDLEVDHWALKGKVPFLRKMWFRYFQPESNAVYLIRRYQYFFSRGGYRRYLGKIMGIKLMRRYSIMIGENCEIGLGFKIWHPYGIIINNVTIGTNFQVQHNVTIGLKDLGSDKRGIGHKELLPVIGNNVCVYAGSYILGPVKVGDNAIIGANSLVIHDAEENGTYVGSPARRVK